MQNQKVLLNVASLINNDSALTPSAGDELFEKLHDFFAKRKSIELDFNGIRFLTSAFLNASVGQLYAHYSSDFIKQHLTVANLSNDDLVLLARVVERAKEYFADKENVEAALREVLQN
jgi:hypothetical protein